MLRLREAQLHHRDQAVAAGEELGVVAVLAHQAERVLHRGGAVILEGSWVHGMGSYLPALAA